MNSKKPKTKEKVNDKLSFLIDHFSKIYDRQMSDFNAFDKKVYWFTIIQMPIIAYFLGEKDILFILSFGIVALTGLYILFPKKIKTQYSPNKIISEYWEDYAIKIESAQAKMAVEIASSIEKNSNVLKHKSQMSKIMIIVFILSAALFAFLQFLEPINNCFLFYN